MDLCLPPSTLAYSQNNWCSLLTMHKIKRFFFDSTFLPLITAQFKTKYQPLKNLSVTVRVMKKSLQHFQMLFSADDLIQNQSAEFNCTNSAKKPQVLYVVPQAQQAIRKAYYIATVLPYYTPRQLACQTH